MCLNFNLSAARQPSPWRSRCMYKQVQISQQRNNAIWTSELYLIHYLPGSKWIYKVENAWKALTFIKHVNTSISCASCISPHCFCCNALENHVELLASCSLPGVHMLRYLLMRSKYWLTVLHDNRSITSPDAPLHTNHLLTSRSTLHTVSSGK